MDKGEQKRELKGEERRAILQPIETQMRASHHRWGDLGPPGVSGAGSHDQAGTRHPQSPSDQQPGPSDRLKVALTVARAMPISSPATAITAAVWKPDGGTWMWYGCRCWHASEARTTWWRSLPSWRSISATGSMRRNAPS